MDWHFLQLQLQAEPESLTTGSKNFTSHPWETSLKFHWRIVFRSPEWTLQNVFFLGSLKIIFRNNCHHLKLSAFHSKKQWSRHHLCHWQSLLIVSFDLPRRLTAVIRGFQRQVGNPTGCLRIWGMDFQPDCLRGTKQQHHLEMHNYNNWKDLQMLNQVMTWPWGQQKTRNHVTCVTKARNDRSTIFTGLTLPSSGTFYLVKLWWHQNGNNNCIRNFHQQHSSTWWPVWGAESHSLLVCKELLHSFHRCLWRGGQTNLWSIQNSNSCPGGYIKHCVFNGFE